jgi:hypothetical protein
MLLFPHELKDHQWYFLHKIYVLKSRATNDIFYVGLTTLPLRETLSCHSSEAYNDSEAYFSPKNTRIRKERGYIQIETLFHVSSYAAQWYKLASIEILNEIYQLTNVKKQVHKYCLVGGRDAYTKIELETRDKLRSSSVLKGS